MDPNNHAPAVTPGDLWEDHVEMLPTTTVQPRIRLPRKSVGGTTDGSARSAVNPGDGLKIESVPQRRLSAEEFQPLEVQQIGGAVVRLNPEVSSMPRMPRQTTQPERPVIHALTRSPQDESKEWGRARQLPVRWILGSGLGIATLVIVPLMLLPMINQSNAARFRSDLSALVVERGEPTADLESLNDMAARQIEAEQIFMTYASAAKLEEILPRVRDAAAVAPLMRAYPRQPLPPEWHLPATTSWNILNHHGLMLGLLEGNLPDYSCFCAYFLLDGHQLQLDWKATTGYGTATFAELARQQGDPTEIRTMIKPAGYFTEAYPEAQFQCYQLVAPDAKQTLWGYVRRADPVAGDLGKLMHDHDSTESSPVLMKATIRLAHGPAGSLLNQWQITALLHPEWITP